MTDDNLAERAPTSFSFGPFTLVPNRQLLLQGEVPVRIGGRALDILTALVERPGELISKRELMVRAWPSINVDDERHRRLRPIRNLIDFRPRRIAIGAKRRGRQELRRRSPSVSGSQHFSGDNAETKVWRKVMSPTRSPVWLDLDL